jgi:hypothetical protein
MIWSASLMAGLQDFSQTGSGSNLESVATNAPFVTQNLRISAQLPDWWTVVRLSGASFEKSAGTRGSQPPMRAFEAHADVFRPAGFAGSWHLGLGAHLGRAFRWVKADLQSVAAKGTLAVGPAASLMRNYGERHGEMGILLELPVTGILTGGQIGANVTGWREWNLLNLSQDDSLLARLSADASYLRWSKPESTGLFAWAVWAGPVLRLSVSR